MQNAATQNETGLAASPFRTVTPEEFAHYQKFGWVKLKGFASPAIVKKLLEIAYRRMGRDGDSNAPFGINISYFNAEPGEGLTDPLIRLYLGNVGQAAKTLMNRKSGVGVRYLEDFYAPKLPSSQKTKNMGNGPTSFHQDFITFAIDRTGGMTFWLALEDYHRDFGTMSFISGSHRIGILGDYMNYGGRDIRDIYPELRDLEMSEPMTYTAGDVTVHNHMTVHGASSNVTDRPRWAYLVLVQPADSHWTGAPPQAYDSTDWVPNQTFDDERFPVLG